MDNILQKIAEYSVTSTEQLTKHFIIPTLKEKDRELLKPEDIFRHTSKAIIVGAAGSGKTTLLKFLCYYYSRIYLAEPATNPIAVFIPANSLNNFDISELRCIIEMQANEKVSNDIFERYLKENKIILLVDGLDEINPILRRKIFVQINDFSRQFSHLRIILSTRPIALKNEFQNVGFFNLVEFNDREMYEYVSRFIGKENTKFFMEATTNSFSKNLIRNPLQLKLLLSVYKSKGFLPLNLTSFYSDSIDYLFSTWEQEKHIASRSLLSLQDKYTILEQLAIYLFKRRTNMLFRSELNKLIKETPIIEDIQNIDIDAFVQELLTSGILVQMDTESVGFFHLTLQEYYGARAVSKNPRIIIDLISQPSYHIIVILACELMDDIDTVIEIAIEYNQFILAAQCLSHGKTNNNVLVDLIFKEFIQIMGKPFIGLLVSKYYNNSLVHNNTFAISVVEII